VSPRHLLAGLMASASALALALVGCGEREAQGPAAAPGVDLAGKTVSIGLLNDESGPGAAIGRPWAVGFRMLAAQINAGGSGLLPEGWKVKLVERDHGYNPQRSVQLFNEIRDEVLFFGTSFGTPNTLPLRPLLARHKVVVFPASLSSKMNEFEYTPPIGPSYRLEVLRALDWMAQQAGGADKVKLGLVYQHDDYGADGHDAAAEAAPKLGITIVSKQTYAAGQPDFTAIVAALKDAGATHVMLTTLPSATAPILGVAAQLDYKPVWVGNSPSWIDRYFDGKVVPAAIFDNFHWVSSFTFWGEDVPLMKPFLEAWEKFGKPVAPQDYYILAAYAVGLVEMQALSRCIESGDVTREGFFKALRGLKDYDTYGATATPLDFTQFPYVTGTQTRILKPDFGKRGWTVAAGYAKPSTLGN
jgi:ABC-type branched-subunit amino acid transport system substrate-binding protein